MRTFVEFTLNDSDKRLLIVLLFVLVLLFIIVGLIGYLVRFVSQRMAGRMDYEIHDAVIHRVIANPNQLRKYGAAKNNNLFVKACVPPMIIGLTSLIVYIIYSSVYSSWARDYFSEFGTLLFTWNWGDEGNYAYIFGIKLLAKWPELEHSPEWHNEYWGSYLLVPLWLVAIGWYLVACQGYLVRGVRLNKRCHTVFEKSLDDFNYFDDIKASSGPVPPVNNQQNDNGNKPQ